MTSVPSSAAPQAVTHTRPMWLKLNGRRLFALEIAPASVPVRGAVLYLPPFVEEMNRCRSHVASMARQLTSQGHTCWLLDPWGTGESTGATTDPSWADWCADALAAFHALAGRTGKQPAVWGLRSGALLASAVCEALQQQGLAPPERLLLWQPAHDGQLLLNQHLRLRLASQLVHDGQKETSESVRERLAAGEAVEVAGYPLVARLADGLAGARMASPALLAAQPLLWIEVVAKPGQALAAPSRKLLEAVGAAGGQVHIGCAVGAPIWQVFDREPADELLRTTENLWSLSSQQAPDGGAGHAVDGGVGADEGWTDTGSQELPVAFDCEGSTLVGMVHRPAQIKGRGLLLVVAGGPQYRGGVCRMQVHMARELADQGIPVMRFDYRGLGDSAGEFRGFTDVGADLRAALTTFRDLVPGLDEVVLWGGCDAASAALINGWQLPRVTGLVLGNPWVHSEQTSDLAAVTHYSQRWRDRDFWLKLLRLQYNPFPAAATILRSLAKRSLQRLPGVGKPAGGAASDQAIDDPTRPFQSRMRLGMQQFGGDVLLLMSGRSLVSKEFDELVQSQVDWQRALQAPRRLHRHDIPEADQAFSGIASRVEVNHVTGRWLLGRPLPTDPPGLDVRP